MNEEDKFTKRQMIHMCLCALTIGVIITLSIQYVSILYFKSVYVGLYNPVKKEITLFPDTGRTNVGGMMGTSIHEIGHYVWFDKLTNNQREAYCKIYETTFEHVSDYAKTSCAEDFADTYENFFDVQNDYRKIPRDRYKFFGDYVSSTIYS